MKVSVLNMFGTSAVALLAVAGTPASAQVSTTANGPYYATPSWDQKLTTNRFVILANWNGEAVLDRETGLVWERLPSTSNLDWADAVGHCLMLHKGGRLGWRLPAAHELASLIDRTQEGPALPAGHPFINVQSIDFYWTASSKAPDGTSAWVVRFFAGHLQGIDKGSPLYTFAWCVRGGPGGDTQ